MPIFASACRADISRGKVEAFSQSYYQVEGRINKKLEDERTCVLCRENAKTELLKHSGTFVSALSLDREKN